MSALLPSSLRTTEMAFLHNRHDDLPGSLRCFSVCQAVSTVLSAAVSSASLVKLSSPLKRCSCCRSRDLGSSPPILAASPAAARWNDAGQHKRKVWNTLTAWHTGIDRNTIMRAVPHCCS